MKRRTTAALCVVGAVAIIIISGLSIAAISNMNMRLGSDFVPVPDTPLFVGKPVLVLGESPNTEGIVHRLLLSTDNVTVAPNLESMPQYNFDGVIMVDGTWGSMQDLDSLAAVLAPYYFNGTPLALVNMTADVMSAIGAHGDHPTQGPSAISDGVPTVMWGLWRRTTGDFESCIGLGTGSAAGYWNAITELYEWGTLRA